MYLISGMHRSGTSLVAQLFHRAGADLGNPDTLNGPDRWNPDGYFEQREVQAVNIPLIHGPWGKLAYFRLPTTRTILRRADRRHSQIAQVASVYKDKIVKETRFCLTLPAWLEHGAEVRKMMICLRDPAAVAQSLSRRNWIVRALGYRLWMIHLQRLIQHVSGIPTWIVRYENILDPERFSAEFGSAAKFFGLELDEQQLLQLSQKSVKPLFNHHQDQAAELPAGIRDLWQELLARHANQSDTAARPEIPKATT